MLFVLVTKLFHLGHQWAHFTMETHIQGNNREHLPMVFFLSLLSSFSSLLTYLVLLQALLGTFRAEDTGAKKSCIFARLYTQNHCTVYVSHLTKKSHKWHIWASVLTEHCINSPEIDTATWASSLRTEIRILLLAK